MNLLDGIVKSKGVFRTIASVLVAVSQMPIPALAPYSELLVQLAAILGGLGVVKAGAAKGGLL